MIKKIKVISFDIYDTLVQRIVSPDIIYKIIGEELQIDDFIEKRKNTEMIISNEKNGIYNLEEIYNQINLEQKLKKKAMKLEEELEINNAVINPVGLSLYNKYCDDYKLICVSDMYLSKKVINKILEKNNYKKIKEIFISCELNKSKRNFKIFKEVCKLLNVKKNEILHIGDSLISDYLSPKINGLKSKYIKKNNKDNYSKILNKNDYMFYLGYKYFGPVVFEFMIWLNKHNSKNKLFVSREGELLFRFYNDLYDDKNNQMIYLSRKSVLSGIAYDIIKSNKLKEIFKDISFSRIETVKSFIKRFNIDEKYIDNSILNEKINESVLDILCENIEKNKADILNFLKENNNNFIKYLKKIKLNDSVLIDVGWNGSMQNLINYYLSIKNSDELIDGLYLGSLNNRNKKGFLFNEFNDISSSILNYSGILELIFMPKYGSVLGYTKDCEPIFDKSEFSKESLEVIEEIQKGISCYINDRKKLSINSLYNQEYLLKKINEIGLNPNKKDILYFGNIDFYDNGENFKLINKKNGLKKDFLESKWKVGFLKKKLKLKFNYNKVLNFLRMKSR